MERVFVVVGANLCGGTAVHTLRQEGFEGRIILVGEEPQLPYERPPLSKEYLRGEQDLASVFLREDDWYQEQGIDTRLGTRATRLSPSDRVVELDGGERIAYDALLLATGARPGGSPVPSPSGSVTSAPSRTPTGSAAGWRPPVTWWSWAPGSSGRRWRPRAAAGAST